MNTPITPIPVNGANGNGSGLRSGNASAFGGAVAVLWIVTQHMKGIDYPAGYEGALAVTISSIFVYARALLEKITGVKVP